jgi:hypothetical protein
MLFIAVSGVPTPPGPSDHVELERIKGRATRLERGGWHMGGPDYSIYWVGDI